LKVIPINRSNLTASLNLATIFKNLTNSTWISKIFNMLKLRIIGYWYMYDYRIIRVLTSGLVRLFILWALSIILYLNGNPIQLDPLESIPDSGNDASSEDINTNANQPATNLSEQEMMARNREIARAELERWHAERAEMQRVAWERWHEENDQRQIRYQREMDEQYERYMRENTIRENNYRERLRELEGEDPSLIARTRARLDQERHEVNYAENRIREEIWIRRVRSMDLAKRTAPAGVDPRMTHNPSSSFTRADSSIENQIFNHYNNRTWL
jgi:hypothetical protein